jgi:hypothetical protein
MLSALWCTLRRGVTVVAAIAAVVAAATATVAVAVTAGVASNANAQTCGALPRITLPDRIADCSIMYTPALSVFVGSADDAGCPTQPFALRLDCVPPLVNVQGFPSVVAPIPGAAFDLRYVFSGRLPSVLAPTAQTMSCTAKANGTIPDGGDTTLVLHLANCACNAPVAPVLALRARADAQRGAIVTVRNVALPTCAAVQGVVGVNDSRVRLSAAATSLFSFTRGYNQTFSFAFNVTNAAANASSSIPVVFAAALSTGITVLSAATDV